MLLNFFFKKIKKKLTFGARLSGGRNFLGRICVFHRGGGNKRRKKLIDRYRRLNQLGTVIKLLRDMKFSAFLAVIIYDNGLLSFIIVSSNVFAGARLFSGDKMKFKKERIYVNGSALPLSEIKLFSAINNIEMYNYSGSKLARAGGVFAFIVNKIIDEKKATLKLSSGWQITVPLLSMASIGIASNVRNNQLIIGKAGLNRALGFRPTVRGVVKNPCDHPHGGGEGKGSPPAAQVSPWGILTKGTPTKNKKVDRLKRRFFKFKN